MPEIDNPYDDEMKIRLRAEQDDPTVMYLVVRKATPATFVVLAEDAVRATRRCVNELRDAPAWQASFTEWLSRSFRKVTLRAEPREWEALLALDHVREGDVLCLPPRRRAACEKAIKRLQAHKGTMDLPALVVGPGLNLAVNGSVEMSAGKALAQLAHCALMRGDDVSLPIHVGVLDPARWQALQREHDVAIVRDAGLTEITPGSETVMAFLVPQ